MPVRAQPGARQNAVRGTQDGALKVAVTQIAEKGKANKAIMRVLCKSLSLRRSQLTLIHGETSANKTFLVSEIALSALRCRVEDLIGPD